MPAPGGGSTLNQDLQPKPDAAWKRPFVARFARTQVSQLLDGSVARVEAQARAAFADTSLTEAPAPKAPPPDVA